MYQCIPEHLFFLGLRQYTNRHKKKEEHKVYISSMIDEQIKYSETNIIHGALGLEE